MMLPGAFIPQRSLRQRGAWSHFVRKGRSLVPEFADEWCELGHKTASRLQTQARRRTSVWTHREADITTIEHRVSFGSKQKWLSLNGMSALPRRADIVSSVGKVRFVPRGDIARLI
jgi:hypothetical protein